jgi:hypothetical protein
MAEKSGPNFAGGSFAEYQAAKAAAAGGATAAPPPAAEPEAMADAPVAVREGLITLATLSPEYRAMVDGALATRNKERILSGLEKYESIEAMVESYKDYEGRDQGLSDAQCEDAVLRFLQRRALLEEGGTDGGPQEIVTFGLLAMLVGGIAFSVVKNGVQF